ncbi:sugar ABC transporter substrate-binding protein [Streptomyces avermitilis]|uniref:ABC transporter substrate-binding protein n=1 Tax=Streptomyces avermitilis (strain ATCC 31267 / DSM 46492 / JCM 5070 / NBRC 14893 / NCIMB 12804 / NRRL 8165 / MA-4680) TaxID=227882 RepID=Q82N94_STRAW|nr:MULTISPECIES: ABC transporter substrate-binding protein [Streptomyces]KUN55167.1 sugar ABC transporter substrate-binding protein [Streptomyces avermitilis]MYS97038.1 extracellular solute-binding protein [Streptomyces sp. SID5469]OOV26725.1 sugar ABC transporter substrate-binding protein [Streptomyces avermitilis]BAC69119.1 putative ABC transporter substrate-binding protein [Streptomyces avermitilis MA-4680 = NBRC 14893]
MESSRSPRTGRRHSLLRTAAVTLSLATTAALAGCASADTTTRSSSGQSAFKPAAQKEGSRITVWADSTRLPSVQAYQKSHPDVKMKIVTYDGGADGSTYLQSKVQLFDRTGSGWPDVVFGTPTDVTWASEATKPDARPFAAPLDEKLVPQSTLDEFAKGSLTPCEFDGHTYCMRNDIAQVLLWYNKSLMDKWGYKVPTTWEDYEALGKKVAKDHPGYLVGSVGDTNSHESYFWSGQCPAFSLVKPDTLRTDLRDPKCTRMAKLLDDLIGAKAIATQGFFSQGFAENSGGKVLMAYGPSWYGQYLFKAGFKTPAKQIAAAPPLAWKGESTTATGNVGGGVWMVSSHSANLKASTDLVTWLTTSDENQAGAPTYPAYTQAAKAWLANPANRNYFANDVSEPFEQAANEVWTGWSNTRFSDSTAWSSVVLPALTSGKSLTETLPAWQREIAGEAKSQGYKVVDQ